MSRLGSVVLCWMLLFTVAALTGAPAGVAAAAGNDPVQVSPLPGNATISEGESVQIDYRINTTNNSVYAYDIVLAYDDVRVTDISEGAFLRSGIERTLNVTTTVDNEAGVARIARSRIGNTSATGDGVLFTVTYAAAQPATDTTEFVTVPEPRFLNRNGTSVDAVGNNTTVTVRVPQQDPTDNQTDAGGSDATGGTTSGDGGSTLQTAVELVNRTDSKLAARIDSYQLGDRISISPDEGIGNGNVTVTRVTAQYDLGTTLATDLSVAVTTVPPSSTPTYQPAADNQTVGYVTATQEGVLAGWMERGRFVFELADGTLGDETSPDMVTMLRYHDNEWEAIETEHIGDSRYVATTSGYSTFAVVVPSGSTTDEVTANGTATTTTDTVGTSTERSTGTTQTGAEQSASTDTTTEAPTGQELGGFGGTAVVAVVAVVVVVGIAVYLVRQ